jgi:tetratricopeptide (TPR) repeat protein
MGCVLYEMLTGKLPFTARKLIDFIRAHCIDTPASLRSQGVVVPSYVEEILDLALAKDPGRRIDAARMGAMAAAARARLESKVSKRSVHRRIGAGLAGLAAIGAAVIVLRGKVISWNPAEPERPVKTPPATEAASPADPSKPAQSEEAPVAKASLVAPEPTSRPRLRPARLEAPAATPPAADDDVSERAKELLLEAQKFEAAGDYRGAIAKAEEAVKLKPSKDLLAIAYRTAGTSYFHEKQFIRAQLYLELYRPNCPPADRQKLDELLAVVRTENEK